MGMYLNPGNANLRQGMNSEVYVDKSMLVSELNRVVNTERKYVCVSRARRFGKSMAGNMISAYYSRGCDSRELFDRLEVSRDAGYELYLNKLNVVKFDLNAFYCMNKEESGLIASINNKIVREFRRQYPEIEFGDDCTVAEAIGEVFDRTGVQFVVIIDEYDVLVREKVGAALFQEYLQFLNGLFKNADLSPAIALAYITGILPLVRDRIQSKLNVFQEYTMLDSGRLTSYFGFTASDVQRLCGEYGMDYDECCRWYDGYRFDGVGEMFNPNSVVCAMTERKCDNYWSRSGSYEVVSEYINMNFEGIRDDVVTMIGGGKVDVRVSSFRNTVDDFRTKDEVFTYLLHIGYLAYDSAAKQCCIPNEEVRQQWVDSLMVTGGYKEIYKVIESSKALMDSLLCRDEVALAEALDRVQSTVLSPMTYNNEAAFQTVLGVAFFYANTRYTVYKEAPGGKGYADLVLIPYLPDIPAVVVELKNRKHTGSALVQIRERRYYEPLSRYAGNILFAGISYDPDTKRHECRIEEFCQEGE